MTALPLSNANISALIGSLSGQSLDTGADGKQKNTDQFASLLDVVGGIADDNAKAQLSLGNNKKDDGRDAASGNVIAPVQFRDAPRPVEKKSDDKYDNVSAVKKDDAKNDKVQSAQDDRADDANDEAAPVAQNKTQNKIAQNDDKQVTKSNNATSASDNENNSVAELSAKIADKVDDLSSLLSILAAFFAQLNAPQNVAAVVTANNQVASVQVSVQTKVQNTTDLPIAFADLKNTLAQLQQFLQANNIGANNPAQNLTDTQAQQLSAINSQLADELAAIKNFLPNTDNIPQDIKTQLPQIAEITPLLKSDLAIIKDALKNFRDNNSENSTKDNAPTFTAPTQNVVNTDNSFLSSDAQKNNFSRNLLDSAAPIPSAENIAASQTAATQNPQASNPQNNNTPNIVVANYVPQTSGLENNSGGNLGQGGNNQAQQQFTIAGVSASSAPNASEKAATNFSEIISKATHTPVAEQISFQIKQLPKTGSSSITIQLDPEELGKLDIKLDVDSGGKAGITITADNKQTLDLLQRDARGLEKALADAGLKADSGSLSFNLRGGEQNGGQQNNSQAASSYRRSQPEEDIVPLAAVVRSYVVTAPDGLDISI